MRKHFLRKLVIVTMVASACGWLYTKRTKGRAAARIRTTGMRHVYSPRVGEYKGGSRQSGLAFQDSAGTLRFFTNIPSGSTPLVALEIRRSNATN
jgi:hypothetical protein